MTMLSPQEKAGHQMRGALHYLRTLARARAEAAERIGPWRDKEPSREWWDELIAAENRNASEIKAAYVSSLPLAARAPEIADLVAQLPADEWGADELATLGNWLNGHGFTV